MKIPKITIILPNYNSFLFIKKTINSVINQSYKNWKLIIVDDCSDEKTKSILKKFLDHKKIKIFWLKKNKGAAYCRNFAIKKSKSKYLAFIDSDDVWKKQKLKKQINFMEKFNYDFSYTNYETFGKSINYINPPNKINFDKFIHNTSIGTSTMIITSKVVKGINFTNTKICEDYIFKCKILKKIKYAYCLNQYLTKYRLRENSLQSNPFKNFYWIWKINYLYNQLSFFQNCKSLFLISINSLKKYGLKL